MAVRSSRQKISPYVTSSGGTTTGGDEISSTQRPWTDVNTDRALIDCGKKVKGAPTLNTQTTQRANDARAESVPIATIARMAATRSR